MRAWVRVYKEIEKGSKTRCRSLCAGWMKKTRVRGIARGPPKRAIKQARRVTKRQWTGANYGGMIGPEETQRNATL
jgi:hypothetical protein